MLDNVIWPSLFAFLYILAGVSLETGFGLFNELYIMLYCLVVTLTAFVVALRKNSMSLSVIALLAGIAMPFIIEDAYETAISVFYSFAVISSAIGLYLYHGWALLLLASSFGFWGTTHIHTLLALSRRDTDIIRTLIFIQWLCFWSATTIRERFLVDKGKVDQAFQQRKLIWFNLFILVGCTHLIASTYYNIAHWAPWGISKGLLYLSASIGFAVWERKHPLQKGTMSLFYPNYVVSVFLLAVGIWLGTTGDYKLITMAVLATTIILVAHATRDIIGMAAGCTIQVYIILWSSYVLIVTEPTVAVFNQDAMVQLFVVFLLAIQSHIIDTLFIKLIYEGIVHAMLNMWLYREFAHSENYLYFVTALYPAAVQVYAYFKGDIAPVTLIRMLYGDLLWLWLFIAQTLPRLLFLGETDSWVPFFSLVGVLDIFVVTLALHSSLLQDSRLQGTTRWIYMAFCNATWVSLIYRDVLRFNLIVPFLGVYLGSLLILGFWFNSFRLKLGTVLTFIVLIIDDIILFPNTDVLWKGTLALFAGIVALAIMVIPKHPLMDETDQDPIQQRAEVLSKSGKFNLSTMSFDFPPSPPRTTSALNKSPASKTLQAVSKLRSSSQNNISRHTNNK